MKKMMKRQLLSVLFILSMIFTTLFITSIPVFAEDIEIETIEILGVVPPVSGVLADNNFHLPKGALYVPMPPEEPYSGWHFKDGDGNFQAMLDEFVPGESYWFIAHVEIINESDEDFIHFPDTPKGTVNGIEAEATQYGSAIAGQVSLEFKVKEPVFNISVNKTDENGKTLKGATICLEHELLPGSVEPIRDCKTTDKNGKVTFELAYGTYTLLETIAPDGYVKSDKSYTLSVGINGVYITGEDGLEDDGGKYKPVTFINTEIPGPSKTPIHIYKKDENGELLEGATIGINLATPIAGKNIMKKTTNKNGRVTFYAEDIIDVFGKENEEYIISEISAPEGYKKTNDTFNIIVATGSIKMGPYKRDENPSSYKPVTFVNTKIPRSVESKIPTLIKDDHFAYMMGYPGHIFKPEGNMQRSEAVVMFSRLLSESMNIDEDYRGEYYPDIDNNAWYANQMGYMHKLGVLKDFCRDGKFRPRDPVTRAEFATLAAQFDNLSLVDKNSFTDVADDHWAIKYINSSAEKGWITGYPDKSFKPEGHITRSEVVTLVNRILERYGDKDYLEENIKNLPHSYKDLTTNHWAYLQIMEASIGHDFIKEGNTEKWTKVYD